MSFVEQLKASINDISSYSQFAYQKVGKTLKYLFLIFSILYLITGGVAAKGLYNSVDQYAVEIQHKVPDFKMVNGELEFSGKQPYTIHGQGDAIFVVDTTGQTQQDVLDKYMDGVLILKDKAFIKQQNQIREVTFQKNWNFNRNQVAGFIRAFKVPIVIISFLFGFLVQFIGKLLSAVFLAFVGMFINSAQKGKLKFGQLWNVGVYALTLPMIIDAVVSLTYPIPGFVVIYFVVGMIYAVKGVQYTINNSNITVE